MLTSNATIQSILSAISSIPISTSKDDFMQRVVEIVDQRLRVDLVGVFLFSSIEQIAVLRAGAGEVGRVLVAKEHRIPLDLSPDLLAPTIRGEMRVLDGWSGRVYSCLIPAPFDIGSELPICLEKGFDVVHSHNVPSCSSAQLPAPRWEIALPLRAEQQTFGALYLQILEFPRFAIEDCSNLQWLADQIAMCIQKRTDNDEIQPSSRDELVA